MRAILGTVSRTAVVLAALVAAGCSEPGLAPDSPLFKSSGANAGYDNGGSALEFNGADANTSTRLGKIITTQIDNISYDAMVRFDGPNAGNNGQAIFYNGHGAVTGWGILVLGPSDGVVDGTLAILAGGITVDFTNLVLTQGTWQHLRAARVGGVVTVTLDAQTYSAGIPVHPVGVGFRNIERTTIGGSGTFDSPSANFHGAIDNLTVSDVPSGTVIEHWAFDEGSGHSASSDNGTVLCLGNTTWASGKGGQHNGTTALGFNGCDANTSTPLGNVVTTQIDDIAYDAAVRYDGANADKAGQAIFYNGHGAVTGWGILVLGPSDGVAEGTIAILAGGITVAFTPLQLTRGTWQHIRAERRAGIVTVTLDDQTLDLGYIPVHPVGAGFAGIERTSVGGSGTFDSPSAGFHGAIDRLLIQNLADDTPIERWNLNERGGPTATGVNGNVLYLGNTDWVSHHN